MQSLRLDDLYRMVAHIYGEQNEQRTASATFAHFVEVCGMLTAHDRRKKRDSFSMDDALCKALGWYFPLLAKFRVTSVEDLVFRKYPYACPYCRSAPHSDAACKNVRGTGPTVNHKALRDKEAENRAKMPVSLDGWQRMFQDIYPRSIEDRSARSTLGLMEELGELAEAIRVFDRHPKYFAGEAADVFSYLMGIANEYSLREQQDNDRTFSFDAEFMKRYPGLCVQCGHQVCICPAIPDSTVGRMAKELSFDDGRQLFFTDASELHEKGAATAGLVLESVGGYRGLVNRFPFDRGDANKALVLLSLRLADALQVTDPTTAQRLHSIAVRVGTSATYPGSKQKLLRDEEIVGVIKAALGEMGAEQRLELLDGPTLSNQIGKMLTRVRVLLAIASPADQDPLRVMAEDRVVREAIQRSRYRDAVIVRTLTAATPNDVHRALLEEDYDIVHIAGHADEHGPLLETEAGTSVQVEIDTLKDLLRGHPTVSCLILSGCSSLAVIDKPIVSVTVGMEASVGDEAAVEFARGFYDAIGAGRPFAQAAEAGVTAVKLKKLGHELPVKVLVAPAKS